jgi:hypothetical protein
MLPKAAGTDADHGVLRPQSLTSTRLNFIDIGACHLARAQSYRSSAFAKFEGD